MIDIVILYILNKYDATIYRIARIIDETFMAYLKASTGTINPALKRLKNFGCVEFTEKMSDGGMLSKIYSITPVGKEHLANLLLSFECKNPYYILNDVKIALCCSSVLSIHQYSEFKENLKNYLELYKIKLENGLSDYCDEFDLIQKRTMEITIKQAEELLGLL